jgi:putative FmdB family regulatory protein
MPTYEYACKSCGSHLEVVQSFKDAALTECPTCGGDLRKVFGNIGIAFKGSGFYRTDSRGKAAASASASKTGEATTSDKGETKTQTDKSKPDKSKADGASSAGSPSTPSAASAS